MSSYFKMVTLGLNNEEMRYIRRKKELLLNKSICKENRVVFAEFFDFEERKLKRYNNLSRLDEASYKTLNGYVFRFKNVNNWFKNKSWGLITKNDIKKVYDDLEDGIIRNKKGGMFIDRKSYYNKVFKSKPFALVGKDKLAQEVIEFTVKSSGEVRFIEFETFLKITKAVKQPKYVFLIWLAFDIGENINSLLKLEKRDFTRAQNPTTGEVEYRVNLRKEILKRQRTSRSEFTNFKETVQYADIFLEKLGPDDLVFNFKYGQACKFFEAAVDLTNAVCIPGNQKVTWKDLRSSMTCYLLKEGWSREELNARLGHKPSSTEIDKYINFLSLDKHEPKKKLYDNNIHKLTDELEKTKQREKLTTQRLERQTAEIEDMKNAQIELQKAMYALSEAMVESGKKNKDMRLVSDERKKTLINAVKVLQVRN